MAIWFCEMDIVCPKQWDELAVTADPLLRDCSECGKPVHFIDTQQALEAAAAKGRCVAFLDEACDDLPYEKRRELHRIARVKDRSARMMMGLPRRTEMAAFRAFLNEFNEAEKDTKK